MSTQQLIQEALAASESSYSPYSRFMVGAALLAHSGKIYRGANVENAAYSPGICAERAAFTAAVNSGERRFTAIAITAHPWDDEPVYAYPCGVCRQVMAEFCQSDFKIIVAKSPEAYSVHTLGELLPYAFGPQDLQ